MARLAIFRGEEMGLTEEGHKKFVQKNKNKGITIIQLYRYIIWKLGPASSIYF